MTNVRLFSVLNEHSRKRSQTVRTNGADYVQITMKIITTVELAGRSQTSPQMNDS